MRPRKKTPSVEETSQPEGRYGLDVNAVVSYNLKAIRERQGWTQQQVADRLAQLTGPHPSASVDLGHGARLRRRTPAPLRRPRAVLALGPLRRAYRLLLPPAPGSQRAQLADTGRPVTELYAAVLGHERQLAPVDERLAEIGIRSPDEADEALVAILGAKTATDDWHDHFRTWRKRRLREVERQYGDRLDEVAEFLAEFAAKIKAVGPKTYLESMAHNERDAKRERLGQPSKELPPDRRS